jgi:hypothetical protein
MGFAKNIMGAGVPAAAAQADTISSVASAVSAAGTTQGTATLIQADWNDVTTVAASAGVILYNGMIGDGCFVFNAGLNALTVYPPTSGKINGLSANAGVIIGTNTTCAFYKISALVWRALLSA